MMWRTHRTERNGTDGELNKQRVLYVYSCGWVTPATEACLATAYRGLCLV